MTDVNADQKEFWTHQAGPTWVDHMRATDAAFAPILERLLDTAAPKEGERVLDIGCGAGTSSFALANRVGATGHVTGVDISGTLLEVANTTSGAKPGLEFVLGDAQTHAFDRDSTDLLFSRFGVMFFDNNDAAFGNMARALRPGGRFVFATWGAISENPYFTVPAALAKREIGAMPRSDPDAPGPFAMRDAEMVQGVLTRTGFAEITVETVRVDLTPTGDRAALAQLMCAIGPAQRALTHFDVAGAAKDAFIEKLVSVLAPFDTPEGLRLPAEIHFFSASKPA